MVVAKAEEGRVRIPNLGYRLFQKALGRLRRSQMEARDFDGQLALAGLGAAAWRARRRQQPRQTIERAIPHVAALVARCPAAAEATLRAADLACAHQFDLLGSGPFVPVDDTRPSGADGYRPIDWYLDPPRQLRFPRGIPHKDWRLYEMRPANADIKYPWELARCQHIPALGQAWRIRRDPRYARELAHQIDDFMEANPVGIGINWTCTMDVAIRAANWCLGLALVADSPALDEAFLDRAWRALFDHGRFIFANLENTYEVTSNHYLSNVVGLFFLASEFADLPAGQQWDAFCRAALEREIDVQVLPDGADFESSVPYHRLVSELFLASARLAQLAGRPLSDSYHQRLRAMIAFHLGVLRPDGLMPQVGDADDGRLHILTDPAGWVRGDGRHLLAPAALVLGEPAWLDHAGRDGVWEAGWWGFDPAEVTTGATPPPPSVRLFPDAGLFVARTDAGDYLLVSNGRVGTKGIGNHKHNDQLSFEFHGRGVPLIVDPGSFVYTSDFERRNRYRATAAHNTLQVDGVEQNELRPDLLFRMFEAADPEHLDHGERDGGIEYLGRHRGYARCAPPVIHQRRFRLDPISGVLEIEDCLEGTGPHRLDWHLQCAPGVQVAMADHGAVRLTAGGRSWELDLPPGLEVRVEPGAVSPSYGRSVPAPALGMSLSVQLEARAAWSFRLAPVEAGAC